MIKNVPKSRLSFCFLLLLFATNTLASLFAENKHIEVKYLNDWESGILSVQLQYNYAKEGFKLPGARSKLEEQIKLEFPSLMEAVILKLRVDSSNSIENLIHQGSISPLLITEFSNSAKNLGSVLDLAQDNLQSNYIIELKNAHSFLVRHRTSTRPPRAHRGSATRAYTGIVVFVDESLPIHGTKRAALARPCFFPKIWDSEMNLIWERHMVKPHIALEQGMLHYSQRSSAENWENFVGQDPMFIIASALFGIDATDPIISLDDSQRILSNTQNRSLLEEGRLIFVVHPSVIREGN